MTSPPSTAPTRDEACTLAEIEYAALLTMLESLDEAQWAAATECPPWSVRDLAAHLAGAAEEAVRLRVQMRHLRVAKRRVSTTGAAFIDMLNEQQLADRAERDHVEILAELTTLAGRAPAARRRTPWLVRRRPLPTEAGGLPGDTMAELLDVTYTRDIWMHRVDIARATGCALVRSDAEAAVVEQVVRDLARSWAGEPFTLSLSGRVAGTWSVGEGAAPTERVELDCVAAARLWSGRSNETGLRPDTPVRARLLRTRLLF